MKKLYFIFIFCMCFSHLVSAQILLSEDFETGSFPPLNWTLINSGTGNSWVRSDNPLLRIPDYQVYSGTKAVVYEYNSTNAANAWLITPALNLTAGQSYGISFYYRVVDNRYPEKLKVTVGKQATVVAQDSILWNNNGSANLTNTEYQRGITQFIPGTSGNYNFGFNCYSDKDEDALLLDSIVVRVAPASPPSCVTNVTPANQSTGNDLQNVPLQWNGPGTSTYDLYFDTNNPPTTKLGTFTANGVLVSSLAYSTTYYWYVVPYNAAGYAKNCSVTNVTSFTTKAVPPKPAACATNVTPANNAVNVSAPSASFSVTPVSGATAYELHITDVQSSFITIKEFSSATFTYDNLQVNKNYQWYVIPLNDGGKATGCTSTSTSFTTGSTLPVMFKDFYVTTSSKNNLLNWSTATEQNNNFFEVQRSEDGVKFEVAAIVKTKALNGNSSSLLNYIYEDVQPPAATICYRLRQVDKDGHESYSSIIKTSRIQTAIQSFYVLYPNPVKDRLQVKLTSALTQNVVLTLTDAQGRSLQVIEKNVSPGETNVQLQLSSLKSGLYYFSATFSDGKKVIEKVVKVE